MASSKEFLSFVLGQLSDLEGVSSRAMMGEYVLYCRGRVIGGVYDDRLLLKSAPGALRALEEAGLSPQYDLPYPGAKEMLVAPVDEPELLCRVAAAVADEAGTAKKRG